MGCEEMGGGEDWSQPRRLEARRDSGEGSLTEDSAVLYTAKPNPRLKC